MATDVRTAKAKALAAAAVKKYGDLSAIAGRHNRKVPNYSLGSRALDYALGTGGAPGNAMMAVFGPPSIGKTTILGMAVLRSVQAAGGMTAMMAIEPDVEDDWLERHGVNLDYHVTFRPDTGEEAFEILRDLVYERSVDYILWDSLAATSSAKEQNSEKPQAFGNSALNNWGIKNIATRCWKNNIGVMFINQVRDKPNAKNLPILTMPGGHAVEHWMKIIIQLKPGATKYTAEVDGEKIKVGQEMIAVMTKNKAAEGLGKTAKFDFFHIETSEYGFGVDEMADVLNTAQTLNIIKGTNYLSHDVFPDGKVNGKVKAKEFLAKHPDAVDEIDKEIGELMIQKEKEKAATARERKAQKRIGK